MTGPRATPADRLQPVVVPLEDIFERIADGHLTPAQARRLLHGREMPNTPARLVKDGVWAVDGGYMTGAGGMRGAAEDALREMRRAG